VANLIPFLRNSHHPPQFDQHNTVIVPYDDSLLKIFREHRYLRECHGTTLALESIMNLLTNYAGNFNSIELTDDDQLWTSQVFALISLGVAYVSAIAATFCGLSSVSIWGGLAIAGAICLLFFVARRSPTLGKAMAVNTFAWAVMGSVIGIGFHTFGLGLITIAFIAVGVIMLGLSCRATKLPRYTNADEIMMFGVYLVYAIAATFFGLNATVAAIGFVAVALLIMKGGFDVYHSTDRSPRAAYRFSIDMAIWTFAALVPIFTILGCVAYHNSGFILRV
jgi:hypothetical protein